MDSPDELITACPLCKKTFMQATKTKVSDIAELVAAALPKPLDKPVKRRTTRTTLNATGNG
jgi:hypothetical protein